jgi:4,5-DOPA dioxygenase extradiol
MFAPTAGSFEAVVQPVLLFSHGASVLSADPASQLHQKLTALGKSLQSERPLAALVVSAHFIEPRWTLTSAAKPPTIHDHPVDELRSWRYPVPGNPELAAHIASLLEAEGMPTALDAQRGLDHGAWLVAAPLLPAALGIPVLQLSLHVDLSPESHLRAGRALRSLRDQGILIITSGGMTHNQQEFRQGYFSSKPSSSASHANLRFDGWLREQLTGSSGIARSAALSNFKSHPDAAWAHPSAEHLLPLFVGLGAAEEGVAVPLWDGFQFGLSTAAYKIY